MEITLPAFEFAESLDRRIKTELAYGAEEWSRCVAGITRWEDANLLDTPTPELLAEHKKILIMMIRSGKFIALATDNPAFENRAVAEIVTTALVTLNDKLRLWHSPAMSYAESDRILARCFPNES